MAFELLASIPWFGWLILYLAFAWLLALAAKRFLATKEYGPLIMWKTTRFNDTLDRFSHHHRLWDLFSKVALVFGFGAIGLDYLVRDQYSKKARIALFIGSTLALSAFFYLVFGFFLVNPLANATNDWLSVFYGVGGFAFFILASLGNYGYFIIESKLAGTSVCPGIAPIVPGVEIPGVPLVAPAHAWISFLIILVIHEGMHGVLLRKAKLAIRSTGLLLAGILPVGAFVEPDEEELKKAPKDDQWKVFVAGAGSNLALFAIFSLLIGLQPLDPNTPSVFTQFVYKPFIMDWRNSQFENAISHYEITGVNEKTTFCNHDYPNPAFGHVEAGSTLVAINNERITLAKPLPIKPNEPASVELITPDGNIVTKQFVANQLGRLGIAFNPVYRNPDQPFDPHFVTYLQIEGFLASFFFWLILLNVLVAAANFLPSEPFDGGKIAKVVFLPYLSFLRMPETDVQNLIQSVFLAIMYLVFFINALPFLLG